MLWLYAINKAWHQQKKEEKKDFDPPEIHKALIKIKVKSKLGYINLISMTKKKNTS